MTRIVLLCLAALAAAAASAPARADFGACVTALRADAARAGVSHATLDQAFDGLQPDMKVLEFQKAQPEFKTPIWDYMDGLVDEERVADGKAAMAREAGPLAHAEETYGVSRYMLAAIWGVESNFGSEMGGRPLVQSLSTLACYGERAGYFRSELMAALKIIDRGDIPAEKLAGSWAGAFGQTQFMPSSYLRLAAPGSDGGRDIVDSADDALASTAHYFAKSGWRSGVPWGFEVRLPPGYSGPSGRKAKAPMSAWAARGIVRIDGRPLGEGEAGLLLPAGADGPAFLVTHNFDVVFSYNAASPIRWPPACSRTGSPAGRASSRPGRPTTLDCRGRSGGNCSRCSPGAATTSDSRTARSAIRPRRPSPTLRARSGCRSTAAPRSRCCRRCASNPWL